jgi:hypothetical protein
MPGHVLHLDSLLLWTASTLTSFARTGRKPFVRQPCRFSAAVSNPGQILHEKSRLGGLFVV